MATRGYFSILTGLFLDCEGRYHNLWFYKVWLVNYKIEKDQATMEPDRIAEQNFSILQPGDHICCIYENEPQHAEILTQYLGDGLRQGQMVLYVYDEHSPATILNYLRTAGLPCDEALASGQLRLVSGEETYLRDGVFDPQHMLDIVQQTVEKAIAQGYPAIRFTGEMNWNYQDVPGMDRFMEYEARINELPLASQTILLCLYQRAHTDPEILLDMLLTHPKVAVSTHVVDNFYYLPPAAFQKPGRAAVQFEQCLQNLTSRHQKESELESARQDRTRQHLETMVEQRTAQLQHEIRERQSVEAVLRESEGRYRALVNQAPLSILVAQDGRYVFVNPAIVHRLGYVSAYDLIGKNVSDTLSPKSRDAFLTLQASVLRGEASEAVVTAFLCKDGSVYYSENTAVPILFQARPALLVIGQDVTERLRYEQQLMSSLSEKEVMLREIHHRVKNNLNVIIALIDLQKANQTDAHVLQVFKELQTRVYSMALVHETLFRSPNLANLDFAGYLQALAGYLYSGYKPAPEKSGVPVVCVQVEAENVPLKVETAIPCGLIVNELITNALKYAFPVGFTPPGSPERQIAVRLVCRPGISKNGCTAQSTENVLTLTVSDNGIGLPDGLNWRTTTTLGLQLVQVLGRQLGAQISLASKPGVTWTITFNERKQG